MAVTVQDVLNAHPQSRYTLKALTDLWGGKESLTEAEVLDLPIPRLHRLWILQKAATIDPAIWRKWGQACSERAIAKRQAVGKAVDVTLAQALDALQKFNAGQINAAQLRAKQIAAAATESAMWTVIEAQGGTRDDYLDAVCATTVAQAAHESVEWVKVSGKGSDPDEVEQQVRTLKALLTAEAAKVP